MESDRCKTKEGRGSRALSVAWLLRGFLAWALDLPRLPCRIKCEGLVISNRTLALNFQHAGCEIPLPELHSSSKGILSGNGKGHRSLGFY